ncbi:External NADH-ubiquinone oxidoreductase 1, mitochondrial [Symbiodinium microadriaticum]|uniref:External NADH-ubiquinone oxidoreductase 1, mitochondrial n=1 Tax=Symbiodinium microadriaticum TaxID=2951 RepID=A0A1Q9DZH9_SYMMI|nr:External NADH-ubiquinone oxidoreductase 1, mitochondrial [Symbiodinium microadriaticum]
MNLGFAVPRVQHSPATSWPAYRSHVPDAHPTGPVSAHGAGAILVTVLSVGARQLQKLRSLPRRCSKTHRKALTDDVSQAIDEVGNTFEDALLHVARLPAWLSGQSQTPDASAEESRTRVVVLGTGWAAHAIAKIIDVSKVDVTVVSPRNYFIFTPMLAAASVGTVEYRSILEHIRSSNPTIEYCQGTCKSVDVEAKQISVQPMPEGSEQDFNLPYDVLVVAVGLRPSSLGVPGVDEHCLFLKNIDDARRLRKRVTLNFEAADLPGKSDEERRRLLTFAVVGGGPTGCEFCGELSDFVRNDLRRFYPKLAPLVRIILIHRGKTLLPDFGESLQQAAQEFLETQGIEVVLETTVDEVGKQQVLIADKNHGSDQKALPCGLVVWAAGQIGQDLVRDLHKAIPRQEELAASEARGNDSQLFVDAWLRVCGAPSGSILALGDCARPVGEVRFPNTAQVAAQQGAFVARLLNRQYDLAQPHPVLKEGSAFLPMAQFRGQTEAVPFRFLDLGRLAYLGQSQAVAELGVGETTMSQSKGLAAFVLWRSVYIVKQVSFRNRVLVLFDWIKSRIFGRDLTRI